VQYNIVQLQHVSLPFLTPNTELAELQSLPQHGSFQS